MKLVTKKVAEELPPEKNITPPDFSANEFTEEIYQEATEFTDAVKNFYIGLYNEADKRQEQHKKKLIQEHSEPGRDYLTSLRNHHHNEGLERFVKGTDDFFSKRIIQHDNEFIQKFDAIYKEPTNNFVKAHFLAPFKNIGNYKTDTFSMNLAILWGMNVILFILLYNKALQTLVNRGRKALPRKK